MIFRKKYNIILAIILLAVTSQAQDKTSSGNDAVFNFNVTSIAGKPRQGDLIILKSKKTSKTYESTTGIDGKCTITIPGGDIYAIFYKLFTDTIKYK